MNRRFTVAPHISWAAAPMSTRQGFRQGFRCQKRHRSVVFKGAVAHPLRVHGSGSFQEPLVRRYRPVRVSCDREFQSSSIFVDTVVVPWIIGVERQRSCPRGDTNQG